MKVQIIGHSFSPVGAQVNVALPDGRRVWIALPTHEVLTKDKLEVTVSGALALLRGMDEKMAILSDLMFTDLDIPD